MYIILRVMETILHHRYKSKSLLCHVVGEFIVSFVNGIIYITKKMGQKKIKKRKKKRKILKTALEKKNMNKIFSFCPRKSLKGISTNKIFHN